jgi:hypothetical protein
VTPIRSLLAPGLALLALLLSVGAVAAGGVSGPAFYVDGVLYRTVATPTDLSGTGAPAWSFDTIYDLGGYQPNVATAAPGDRDYNGGRWEVHALAYHTSYAATLAAHDLNGNGVFDNDAEIAAALADSGPAGAMDTGVVRRFVCTVNRVPLGR